MGKEFAINIWKQKIVTDAWEFRKPDHSIEKISFFKFSDLWQSTIKDVVKKR